MTVLDGLIPAAEEGWLTLLDLAEEGTEAWALVGGQMMYLLAAEAGVELPRPTADMDIVVNVRVRPGGTTTLATWLTERGFSMQPSADNIGHRFVRDAVTGPGQVQFDVLGLEHVGRDMLTVPPARTVEVPGSIQAFDRSEIVAVTIASSGASRSGLVRRPNVLGALIAKAAATTIPVRVNRERDWQDAALLLALVQDPLAAAADCSRSDRRHLRRLEPLTDRAHPAWRPLGADAWRAGSTALEFLVET